MAVAEVELEEAEFGEPEQIAMVFEGIAVAGFKSTIAAVALVLDEPLRQGDKVRFSGEAICTEVGAKMALKLEDGNLVIVDNPNVRKHVLYCPEASVTEIVRRDA